MKFMSKNTVAFALTLAAMSSPALAADLSSVNSFLGNLAYFYFVAIFV